ncbi:UDP-3-O-(3-hydroxymyristoyl) glucosamine N-acyltransferase [Candidatus Riesia sp. GBBU]|nr:UDP-3-O-(3-hydroxymyristoyl) glucosamine N-acyltransferase [Candidatus Riesia sp. GBBU]
MLFLQLRTVAKIVHGKLYGNKNAKIYGISDISLAQKGQITFLFNRRYIKDIKNCKATAIITKEEYLKYISTEVLVVKDPYLTYAKLTKIFNNAPKYKRNIHSSSVISDNVKFGENITICSNSVIEPGVELGNNVFIGSGCFIGNGSKIGDFSKILPNVSIQHNVQIGNNCLIQSGTVIGSDGFGYAKEKKKWIKIFHLGTVVIGNNVEIGSCTTIDRGSLKNTVIEDGVIIDNQCQIAHNVTVGSNTAIAGGTIIAGSSKIGKSCMIGGSSTINGHIQICDNTIITGMSMVTKSIKKSGMYSSGTPVQENRKWRKNTVLIMKICKILKRVQFLERKVLKNKN